MNENRNTVDSIGAVIIYLTPLVLLIGLVIPKLTAYFASSAVVMAMVGLILLVIGMVVTNVRERNKADE